MLVASYVVMGLMRDSKDGGSLVEMGTPAACPVIAREAGMMVAQYGQADPLLLMRLTVENGWPVLLAPRLHTCGSSYVLSVRTIRQFIST